MSQLGIARHAKHCGVEVVDLAIHPLEEGGKLELPDADFEASGRQLGLEQLFQRGFAGADCQEFERRGRLGGWAARRWSRG